MPDPILGPLDVSPPAEQLYRLLLERPDATLAQLSEEVGWDSSRIRRLLRTLEERGLVTRTPTRPTRFRPAPPSLALEVLALQRHEEIERARLAATELSAMFRTVARESEPPVQVVRGQEANAHRFFQIQQATRHEVLILDKPPYAAPYVHGQIQVQRQLLARGVRYRTIYAREAIAEPDQLALARDLATRGEAGRVLDDLPLKMLISDRNVGLVPVVMSRERETVVLHSSPPLDALIALFELLWERATPLWPAGRSAGRGLTQQDERLLGYAAAGYTDEAIARRLGVAQRTVERRMRRIMDHLGARTRFQAGLQASKRGILGDGPFPRDEDAG